MKTTQEIAQALLQRRNAMNPIVIQGEMLATLESEGLQEALQRRWLVPDPSTGFLLVNQDAAKVQEMRQVAEHCGHCPEDIAAKAAETATAAASTATAAATAAKNGEEKVKTEESWTRPWEAPPRAHDIALRHSQRDISELLSPATGHDNSSPLSARAPSSPLTTPPPATPTSAGAPPGAPPPAVPPPQPGTAKIGIGDEVLVSPAAGAGATESQTYTGKVSKNLNGMVTVNFGGTSREFPENEVKVVKAATGVPSAGQ